MFGYPAAVDARSFFGVAGAPLVIGLVEVFKATFPQVPSNYYPLVCLVSAICLNALLGLILGSDVLVSVLVGIVTGLSASGLYSFGRSAS